MKQVKAWSESVAIPTYGIGQPDRNPMFLEKRVYQGSSGAVYPLPVIDRIDDEKQDKVWQAIYLENQFLKIMILPELGGRIHMALDKTNDYHFVYHNQVIKPALVGLAGPWISGGIEFNWPQHHRPNTYGPVDSTIEENEDGSCTVWCHEIDRMHRTECRHGFTLHPDSAYVQIDAKMFNRTTLPQTFLWWANPAVSVGDDHQSIFPPDVSAVMDHGKRDVSNFPIATGTYYKVDYGQGPEQADNGKPGTDISRYRNIPVPTSYMAAKSDYNFVGSYDHGHRAGLLHICDHNVSPGKKQWTWGNGEFGQAWDRHLTDEDGPYIELMCGVYTDNQPDFTWLMPGEQKAFTQYFMPYKGIGLIGNATIEAAVGMSVDSNVATIRAYTTSEQTDAEIRLSLRGECLGTCKFNASPADHFECELSVPSDAVLSDLTVSVYDASGRVLVSYTPPKSKHEVPEAAKEIDVPQKLENTEALFLAGQHLEQYRHATRQPMDYYDEGLSRDQGDARCNNAKGKLLARRGCFAESIPYFEKSIQTLTRHNPNAYDCEPLYNLGLSLRAVGRLGDAGRAFGKASWGGAWQGQAFFEMARLAGRFGNHDEAVERCQRCLEIQGNHDQARHLLISLHRGTPKHQELIEDYLSVNPFCFGALYEQAVATEDYETYDARCRDDENTVIELALDYAAFGDDQTAANVLEHLLSRVPSASCMVYYHLASLYSNLGRDQDAAKQRELARSTETLMFANKLEDIPVLESAMAAEGGDAVAAYQLGNLWYDRRQYDKAVKCWEESKRIDPSFPTVWRNLSLAYLNQQGDNDAAWDAMKQAFDLNPTDARVLFELDQLAIRLCHSPADRLARLKQYPDLVDRRDDLYLQWVTLHNLVGDHQAALDALLQRNFHPWEGGEGKIPLQYATALTQLGCEALCSEQLDQASQFLERATHWPENLGEGKLIGTQENNIHYWLGCVAEQLNDASAAEEWFRKASSGPSEPTSAMYYNDQPPHMVYYQGLAFEKLGMMDEAKTRFQKLIDYGNQHIDEAVTIDYFAVSLPDFLVFDPDIQLQHQIHCRYMMALGYLGLGKSEEASKLFTEILDQQPDHLGANIHQVVSQTAIS
ncbi:Tetratricopeptide repeat protein [Rubripirellula obstinata]|uniref:Tetratricopeptide repeat protein n=2 Tax=Rubripirellula obstinata TaxID=406547 RepID=A0A5B1CM85_9BACT|nr:Tetratricopeptide repeat protein [Rubripirellula obstinata]